LHYKSSYVQIKWKNLNQGFLGDYSSLQSKTRYISQDQGSSNASYPLCSEIGLLKAEVSWKEQDGLV